MKNRFKDITNLKFGRLTPISNERIHNGKRMRTWWLCQCDCGKQIKVIMGSLTNGGTKSCGCLNMENLTKHGKYKSIEYAAWCYAKSRCYRKKNISYHNYGGRGIIMCERWKNSFINFFDDMGECPKGFTLDRINTNGNYEPGNCRWVSMLTQANNRRNTTLVTFNGITKSLCDWARHLKISRDKARYMYNQKTLINLISQSGF